MKKLTGNISAEHLLAYLPVLEESIEDRTLMLWMRDEAEQAFVVDMGWNGGMNTDPQNPEAGAYVNVGSASKMGWFLLMDTEIGERTKNADGSYTYPVTVTFSNNVTAEEINAADRYISGGFGGAMRTVPYFFAPAGGTVDSFIATNCQTIALKTYKGIPLGFMDQFLVRPDDCITVTYMSLPHRVWIPLWYLAKYPLRNNHKFIGGLREKTAPTAWIQRTFPKMCYSRLVMYNVAVPIN